MCVESENIDIQDTLYGGDAGKIDISTLKPDDDNLMSISDAKWSQSIIKDEDIIPSHQAASYAMQNLDVDISPRFYDPLSKSWSLVDTGAQVSCCPPSADDKIDRSLQLETVDGSKMPCYGKKTFSFRIGRKTYHQEVFITNTTEIILGMDFIYPNRMDLRWGEFGDYYLYDTRAKISGLLQFVKTPKNSLPRIQKVSSVSVTPPSLQEFSSVEWNLFQVSAIQESGTKNQKEKIPPEYLHLINSYKSLQGD